MATEADLIQKFKDLDIPVGADFEELIHVAFAGANLADQLNSKADDSKVVHTADMRKPASDVVGLEDITQTALPDGTDFYTLLNTAGRPLQYFASNYTHAQTMINKPVSVLSAFILITSAVNNSTTTAYNYTFLNLRDVSSGYSYEALIKTDRTGKITVVQPWHKLADDSKVAHLSGANNFNTVPTVNSNPLLLASSLPSDLARTSQQTNFTVGLQKGGKDVATISDVTTAVNTAMAIVVDRNPSTGVVSDSTTFSDLKVGNGQQVASIDVASSEQEATYKASKFTAPGIVIY